MNERIIIEDPVWAAGFCEEALRSLTNSQRVEYCIDDHIKLVAYRVGDNVIRLDFKRY